MSDNPAYEIVVIGCSVGGMRALEAILSKLPLCYNLAVVVVQHRLADPDSFFVTHLANCCEVNVKEAEEKEVLISGTVYIAPAGYHLLIEEDKTFSLSIDPLINYSIPSIDVLFETAAEVYEEKVVGVVLTGANSDGAEGLATIKKYGGLTIVQDPETAEGSAMPRFAIEKAKIDYIIPLGKIGDFLVQLDKPLEDYYV